MLSQLFSNRSPIESFDNFVLRINGMRGSSEYEVLCQGGFCAVSFYRIRFTDGNEERRLEFDSQCYTSEMLELLSRHKVRDWDGFYGAHPKNVHDGEQFEFNLYSNGDRLVHAEGSANFPKGFSEFRRTLDEMLRS